LGMDHRDAATRIRLLFGGRRHRRVAVVAAAACVGALTLPAAGVVAATAVDGDLAVAQRPAQVDDFACTGPPPFAGHDPEGETKTEQAANRHVEALAFAIWRAATCPLDMSSVPDNDGCTGPPVFAGTPADPADPKAGVVRSPRADEAAAHADARSGCHDTTSTELLAPSATPGVPESVPAGPPDSIPAGPPASTPVGPPDGVPAGPPEGVPAGPPASTPGGPPESVPAGPPVSTPGGPPEDVPTGPPVSTPVGPPDGVPAGPPASTPVGPPAGVPGASGGAASG
jgi:hypothetical protein